MRLSALSTTVPLTPALMGGAGCGGGCEGDCGTTEGANGVDIESEPPQPVNPWASTKSTIPARVLLINAVSSWAQWSGWPATRVMRLQRDDHTRCGTSDVVRRLEEVELPITVTQAN